MRNVDIKHKYCAWKWLLEYIQSELKVFKGQKIDFRSLCRPLEFHMMNILSKVVEVFKT